MPSGPARTPNRRAPGRSLGTLARRAYRRPVTDDELRPLLAFYEAGRREGAFETGIQRALQVILAGSEVRVPRRARSGERRARRRLSPRRSRAGVAAVVLPLEQHAGRRTARRGEPGEAEESGGARARRCGGCWPIRGPAALVANFAGQWLQLRNVKSVAAEFRRVSRLRRQPAAGRSRARRSCSSRASCARTGACSTC